ncbi:peptidase [Amycolatopsis sp. H20-H5]|uniref:peptidase n=1 Tax=Amycolatopsis sp. H20-H5 TaxID=3046309 RepID=UPI002DBBC35F|nr:peptidase [Amycolatopsis sp. H20-H5]MEC3982520.1 peptidase [Amycolatopsis sp. H20-H5]
MYKAPGGTGTVIASGAGTLAFTGVDLIGWIVFATVLLVLGGLLLLAAKRRHARLARNPRR